MISRLPMLQLATMLSGPNFFSDEDASVMTHPLVDADEKAIRDALASFAEAPEVAAATPPVADPNVPFDDDDDADIAMVFEAAEAEDDLLLWQEDANGDLINWADVPADVLIAGDRDGRTVTAAAMARAVALVSPVASTGASPVSTDIDTPKVVADAEAPLPQLQPQTPKSRRMTDEDEGCAIYVLEFEPAERVARGLEKLSGGWTSPQGRELLTIAGLLEHVPERRLCTIKRVSADARHERTLGCSIVVPVRGKGRKGISASPFLVHRSCSPVVIENADRVIQSYLPVMMRLSETAARTAPGRHARRLAFQAKAENRARREVTALDWDREFVSGKLMTVSPMFGIAGRAMKALFRRFSATEFVRTVFYGHDHWAKRALYADAAMRATGAAVSDAIKWPALHPASERAIHWASEEGAAPATAKVVDAWARDIQFARALNGDEFEGEFTFAFDSGTGVEFTSRPIAGRHFGSFAEFSE